MPEGETGPPAGRREPPGALRHAAAILALPAMVTVAVPLAVCIAWGVDPGWDLPAPLGPAVIGVGAVAAALGLRLVGRTIGLFAREGEGTLAPWDETRRLVVAGGWRPVVSRSIRFVGSVDGARKSELLAGARLLWSPVQWDEPFGLTTIEALASGTPVLGTRRGALPEIVTPDVGALGDTLEELVELIEAAQACDPDACRARVEQHFHYRVMATSYLEVYRTLLQSDGRMVGWSDVAWNHLAVFACPRLSSPVFACLRPKTPPAPASQPQCPPPAEESRS